MSLRPRPSSVLVLAGADVPAERIDPATTHHANGVLQAAALLTRERPAYVLINPERAWHRDFVRALPRHARPRIAALGEPRPSDLVDEWLPVPPPLTNVAA